MRTTVLGKVLVSGMLGVLLGVGLALSAPATADALKDKPPMGVSSTAAPKAFGVDGAMVVAALQIMQAALVALIQQMTTEYLLGKGDSAIVEQVAANTIGVQAALNHHARVIVDSTTRAVTEAERSILQRTFGNLSTLRVRMPDGSERTINVGATAPNACRRASDAQALVGSRPVMQATRADARLGLEEHNRGYQTTAGSVAAMREALTEDGPLAFRLDYLQRDNITKAEADRYVKAIGFALNPSPLPPPPPSATEGGSQAVREYEVKAAQLRELASLPQNIAARQLVSRVRSTPDGRSYLQTVKQWATRGIEDPLAATELAGVTEAGLLREISMTLSALLWVETERMESDNERNLLLAVMSAESLEGRQQALRHERQQAALAD